jgi:hypothetical protein
LRQPRPEPFEFEFEFELLEEFDELLEFEFDELLDDEFEFELLDEFELEFDEPLDDELLEELDELLPATVYEPSLLAVLVRFSSGASAEYCLASTAVVASAAMPATRADFNFHCFVMAVTPLSGPSWRSGGGTGLRAVYSARRAIPEDKTEN